MAYAINEEMASDYTEVLVKPRFRISMYRCSGGFYLYSYFGSLTVYKNICRAGYVSEKA